MSMIIKGIGLDRKVTIEYKKQIHSYTELDWGARTSATKLFGKYLNGIIFNNDIDYQIIYEAICLCLPPFDFEVEIDIKTLKKGIDNKVKVHAYDLQKIIFNGHKIPRWVDYYDLKFKRKTFHKDTPTYQALVKYHKEYGNFDMIHIYYTYRKTQGEWVGEEKDNPQFVPMIHWNEDEEEIIIMNGIGKGELVEK